MELIRELLLSAGGTVAAGAMIAVVLSLLQVSKIQINPWDSIRRWIGGKFNAEQISEIKRLKRDVEDLREGLLAYTKQYEQHIADDWRRRILTFDNQLRRNIPHTDEDFTEVLEVIGKYERYCNEHADYKNYKAVKAINNIVDTYNGRQMKSDF